MNQALKIEIAVHKTTAIATRGLQRGASGPGIYVIDANTVVSAALNPNGLPRRAVLHARTSGVIVLSEAVYAEIAEVHPLAKWVVGQFESI